jgi:hypothetical protein
LSKVEKEEEINTEELGTEGDKYLKRGTKTRGTATKF